MRDLKETIEEVNISLSVLEKERENAIRDSREIIRLTKRAIHSIHIGEIDRNCLNELDRRMTSVTSSKDLFQDAMAEYSEALILFAMIEGKDIPTFRELNVTPQAWVLGLADCLGEMRRLALTYLMNSNIDPAISLFTKMEAIFDALMTFDVPDAIVPIRRKQDIARGIMDRTRTDITTAMIMRK